MTSAEAEGTNPSTDVVRGLIVANLAKLDRTVTTLAELVAKVEKDVQRLEKRVDGVEADNYDSEHQDWPACAFAGENGSGLRERCIRRAGHPGLHVGMGSDGAEVEQRLVDADE